MAIAMDYPAWAHFLIEGSGLLVAAAVAYGVVKTKIAKIEKDMIAIRKDLVRIQSDLSDWKQARLAMVVTDEDCKRIQLQCRQQVCTRVEEMNTVTNEYIKSNNSKWTQVATLLGAICQKMEIKLPEWK